MLTLIVARARNSAIGKGNRIPWHAPEDLAFFQRETTGGVVIMGRRTWDSLPVRPLPRRVNIVVTSRPGEGDARFLPLDQALAQAGASANARVYGIGGHSIYAALLPVADRLLITEVDAEVDGADTFFPPFDPVEWVCTAEWTLRRAAPACVVRELLRRRGPERG